MYEISDSQVLRTTPKRQSKPDVFDVSGSVYDLFNPGSASVALI